MNKPKYIENIEIDNIDTVNVFSLMFENRVKFENNFYLDGSVCKFLFDIGFKEYNGFLHYVLGKTFSDQNDEIYFYRENCYTIYVHLTLNFILIKKTNDSLKTVIDFNQKVVYIRYEDIESNDILVYSFNEYINKHIESYSIGRGGAYDIEDGVPYFFRDIEKFEYILDEIIKNYVKKEIISSKYGGVL